MNNRAGLFYPGLRVKLHWEVDVRGLFSPFDSRFQNTFDEFRTVWERKDQKGLRTVFPSLDLPTLPNAAPQLSSGFGCDARF